MGGLIVRPRSRIFHGHDWVYSSEVLKVFGDPADGEVVSLKDGRDRMLGSAIYNSKSQIVARRFSRQRQDLDLDFFERRLRMALVDRNRWGVDVGLCRLVWAESDGLPGVVVDSYAGVLVFQTLTLAMDLRRELLIEAMRRVFSPVTIVERNDAPVRRAEGMELRTGVVFGPDPGVTQVTMDGLGYGLDLLGGQKTGFYLDQREAYRAVARYAAGRRVLDCFANQGAFGLACARAGASSVAAVEISDSAVEAIRRNASANGLVVEAVAANVFDFLKAEEERGGAYDLIILDPPSFTKSKGRVEDAMRGYKEIHLRALKLLKPEGILATFCCSHHVSREQFLATVVEACVDAKRTVRQREMLGHGADHPVLPTIPESEYLKGFIFELVPGR
jgi:23S rRNA (cytosine1962-C5)-methyltransferase